MKRKSVLMAAVLFLLLFLGLSWFGINTLAKRMQIAHMEARFGAAEAALRQGRLQEAGRDYRGAVQAWQKGAQFKGYYPRIYRAYLVAGNSYQQVGRLRAALKCYEAGLAGDPFSIQFLTSIGSCAYRLGEHKKAFTSLQKSSSIYPLKKSLVSVWEELKRENQRASRSTK
jgi:tetratricopeptide (TPR) repeat protein